MKIPFTTKQLKATINDHEILLDFYRGWEKHPRLGKFRRTTHCVIFIDGTARAADTAYFNPIDQEYGFEFDEEYGREEAFRKAILQLNKDKRRLAWQTWLVHQGIRLVKLINKSIEQSASAQ